MLFRDRSEAGTALGQALAGNTLVQEAENAVVIGLPRGGVPLAARSAAVLDLPFDIILVRKLGAPAQPELALGAVAEGDVVFVNDSLVQALGVAPAALERVIASEEAVLRGRAAAWRGPDGKPADVGGRTVIVVDDGIATGATMRVALQALRQQGAAVLVAAAPVGSAEAVAALAGIADDVVCLHTPEPFRAVGEWYGDFRQVSDDEVAGLLQGRSAS